MRFQIGSESGLGMKCSTEEEFFRYLTYYIEPAEENSKEEFRIIIDTDIYSDDED